MLKEIILDGLFERLAVQCHHSTTIRGSEIRGLHSLSYSADFIHIYKEKT